MTEMSKENTQATWIESTYPSEKTTLPKEPRATVNQKNIRAKQNKKLEVAFKENPNLTLLDVMAIFKFKSEDEVKIAVWDHILTKGISLPQEFEQALLTKELPKLIQDKLGANPNDIVRFTKNEQDKEITLSLTGYCLNIN